MANEKLQQLMKQFLNENCEYDSANDCWYDEPYVQDDQLDDDFINKVLEGDVPDFALEEALCEWYSDTEWQFRDERIEEFKKFIGNSEEFDDEDIEETLVNNWFFRTPLEYYLDQEVCMDIVVDTGDMNYDYTLNATYPHYNGSEDEPIDDKASLVWLAKQQGYTKEQLQDTLTNGKDSLEKHGFLDTVFQEVINCCTSLPALFLPVKMTLANAIELAKIINQRDANGYEYEPEKRKDIGSIIIDKKVEPLLYDTWSGGGSCWGIELDKDIILPIKYIHQAIPDGALDYSIQNCYGCGSDCWKRAFKGFTK